MLVLGIFSLMMAVALPTVRISPLLLIRVTSIILLYAAALSFNASYIQAIGSGVGIYSGLFQVTSLSQVIDTFIFVIAAFVILPWAPAKSITGHDANVSMNVSQASIPEYSLIILFTTCGATFLISSADLVSMYLSIELQSFAVYILAALYRDSESATSAGLKYFLLGGLSSGLILLGSALVYSYTGLTSFEGIYSLLSVSTNDSITSAVTIGLTITVVGFLFKIAAAPFHNWAPDVYDGTPTIVTTWLTIMPKISILVFLLELQTGLSGVTLSLPFATFTFNVWKNLLLISSMLSLIIGTVVGLAQFRIKRLFAYSTISHVGFLLLALAINTEESIESFIFYLIQYSITNLNAFLILLAFGYVISQARAASNESTDIQFISQLKGQFRSNPLLGLSLAACLFSMAGIPPLMGFFAKQMVLYSATHAGYYFMSFVAIIVSVISAAYYLRIVRVIHFDASTPSSLTSDVSGQESSSTATAPYITSVHSFTIATLTLAIALFVFKPSFILNSTHLLALSLFNA